MDKLEHYVDQVCRRIGGSRSLRQHVRQELLEHLRDAAAEHQAAGLTPEAALARALEEFGKPEEVRSELEATHGQRLMAVVIDKAIEWKEMTMKAKWLWTSWAYLTLALVIVLEVLLITFNVIFIIPKFQRLLQDGMIDAAELDQQGVMWMAGFLDNLKYLGGHYTTFLLLGTIALIALFEWRVKSENKPFIRLSALGTAAVGLLAVVMLMTASLVIPMVVGMPALGRMARPFALEQVAAIDSAMSGLEQALAKKDWGTVEEKVQQAIIAVKRLSVGPALSSLILGNDSAKVVELRSQLKSAGESLLAAQQAIQDKNTEHLQTALKGFRDSFGPVRSLAKKSPP